MSKPINFQNPEILKKYEIISELGQGAQARVFLAFHRYMNQEVALKVLNLSQFINASQKKIDNTIARFKREMEITAALQHRHIVKIFDCYYSAKMEEESYIAMEYIPSGSLGEHIIKSSLGVDQILQVLADAAAGLSFAHRMGVLHRDIKPGNIFIDQKFRGCIGDFGLAKREDDVNITLVGRAPGGTLHFMGPEYFYTPPEVDELSDVYALGITMYSAITRKRPYKATQYTRYVLELQDNSPIPPRDIDPIIPEDVEQVCLKAIAKKKSDRYSSMEAMRKDLALLAQKYKRRESVEYTESREVDISATDMDLYEEEQEQQQEIQNFDTSGKKLFGLEFGKNFTYCFGQEEVFIANPKRLIRVHLASGQKSTIEHNFSQYQIVSMAPMVGPSGTTRYYMVAVNSSQKNCSFIYFYQPSSGKYKARFPLPRPIQSSIHQHSCFFYHQNEVIGVSGSTILMKNIHEEGIQKVTTNDVSLCAPKGDGILIMRKSTSGLDGKYSFFEYKNNKPRKTASLFHPFDLLSYSPASNMLALCSQNVITIYTLSNQGGTEKPYVKMTDYKATEKISAMHLVGDGANLAYSAGNQVKLLSWSKDRSFSLEESNLVFEYPSQIKTFRSDSSGRYLSIETDTGIHLYDLW